MPFYDFQCPSCEGIFEQRVALAQVGEGQIACSYCSEPMLASPMLTARPTIGRVDRWVPTSRVEHLTGPDPSGPGAYLGAKRSSVLHNCRGGLCSLCA
jgi:hypothetical protein